MAFDLQSFRSFWLQGLPLLLCFVVAALLTFLGAWLLEGLRFELF